MDIKLQCMTIATILMVLFVCTNCSGPSLRSYAPPSSGLNPQGIIKATPLHFKTIPKDTIVNAGERVQLECSAAGEPLPQLSWQKDGGRDFPAARERRMGVSESGNIFYITQASVSDIGTYSCIAKNDVDTILANASLIVVQPAHFSSPMPVSVEFILGTTAVLRCPASGYPPPTIVWYKDDKLLQITERHFLTADDQLLIIVKSRYSDTGDYFCEIKNNQATEFGYTRLEIMSKRNERDLKSSIMTPRLLSNILLLCIFFSLIFIGIMLYWYVKKTPDSGLTTKPTELDPYASKNHKDYYMNGQSTLQTTAASIDLLASSRGVTCVPSSTCSDTASINHLSLDLYKDDYNPYGTVV